MAHKIKVKLGDAEFEAEGTEDTVQAQYDQFLAVLEKSGGAAKPKTTARPASEDDASLARIFDVRQDGTLSFRVHPPDTIDGSDALALLLLGYRRLGTKENVLSTQLQKSARQSGLGEQRIDQLAQPHIPRFILRGGQRKGTTYTLTTQGISRAWEVAAQMPV
jgi:hypothetical protein